MMKTATEQNRTRIRYARYLVRRLVDVGDRNEVFTFFVSSQVTRNDNQAPVGYAELVFEDETRNVSPAVLSEVVAGLFETVQEARVWDDDILGTACEVTGFIQLPEHEVEFIEFMEDAASKLPPHHPLIPRFRVDGVMVP